MFESIFPTPEDAFNYLEQMAQCYDIRKFCSMVLDDSRFKLWSGASKPFQHHYGKHGLVIHTAEVVKLCLTNNDLYAETSNVIDNKKLYLAALFHDAGKMWDYVPINYIRPDGFINMNCDYDEWEGTKHKREIHHISRSNMIWCETVVRSDLTQEFKDDISHAILSHHGQRAWGSPVGPNTRLAWLLHLCDGISARMNDADKWDQVK